jgi:hypothetical protein
MNRGDVIVWVLTNEQTFTTFNRILNEDDMELLQDINELFTIKKMYRIERMTADFDVVELKINH